MSESRPCCEVQTPQRTNKGKLIQAPWNEGNLRKPTDEAGFAWIHVTDPFLIGKTDSLWNRNVEERERPSVRVEKWVSGSESACRTVPDCDKVASHTRCRLTS